MTTVFIDFETSGLDPAKHEIMQAGVVVVDDDFKEIMFRSWPEVDFCLENAEKEALEVNGFSGHKSPISQLQLCCELEQILQEFAVHEKTSAKGNIYRVARLGGHNVGSFDAAFLINLFKRNGKFCPIDYHFVDTVSLAMAYFYKRKNKPTSLKLTALGDFFGFNTQGAHGALFDATLSRDLASIFLGASFKVEHEVTPESHRIHVNEQLSEWKDHDKGIFFEYWGKTFFAPPVRDALFKGYKIYEVIEQ
jgi:DNA polymerase III epsilon subunit-like protein